MNAECGCHLTFILSTVTFVLWVLCFERYSTGWAVLKWTIQLNIAIWVVIRFLLLIKMDLISINIYLLNFIKCCWVSWSEKTLTFFKNQLFAFLSNEPIVICAVWCRFIEVMPIWQNHIENYYLQIAIVFIHVSLCFFSSLISHFILSAVAKEINQNTQLSEKMKNESF